jgi:hypothetical protein
LSSRPERSVVEGPAVSLPVLTQTLSSQLTYFDAFVSFRGASRNFSPRPDPEASGTLS